MSPWVAEAAIVGAVVASATLALMVVRYLIPVEDEVKWWRFKR